MIRRLLAPRYAAFTVLMIAIAALCVGLGTWQVSRFAQKRAENSELRANAHAAAAPLAGMLAPVGSADAGHLAATHRFRAVTATGTYDAAHQVLVHGRSIGDTQALLVLTPFRTTAGTLLVVRGWVPQPAQSDVVDVSTPPDGTVTVGVRLERSETESDRFGDAPAGQVRSINATDTARRLHTDVLDGFGDLAAGDPGARGLSAMPAPDLSNPAGGAVEPQHLAYIAQWYLFALLALAAPPVMVHAERRHAEQDAAAQNRPRRERADRLDEVTLESEQDRARRGRLADRYGTARRF